MAVSTRRADGGLQELAAAVVDRLPSMLDEVRAVLDEEHPEYAAFLAAEFDEVVSAARGFVARLVGVADADPTGRSSPAANGVEDALFEEIGRLHHRHGREVTVLLAAYRSGARVAWRHVSDVAMELRIPPEGFAALAGVLFSAVDRLSPASLRGDAQERSETGYARERQREELAELLLSDRSSSAAVQAAAERVSWDLPRMASVVLVDTADEVAGMLLSRLDGFCPQLVRGEVRIAIVGDSSGPGRRQRLVATLAGSGAVVGTPVPLDRLPASLRLAEHALRLRRDRVLCDDPVFVDENLDAIIVHRDEVLLVTLRRQCLAPLAGLPQAARERMSSTLTVWLTHMGDRKAVAAALHVHPQTVRYRLARLRELFGPSLDDPGFRATLMLALAWGPRPLTSGSMNRAWLRAGPTSPGTPLQHAHDPRSVRAN